MWKARNIYTGGIMALTGLVSLTESLLNQSAAQTAQLQTANSIGAITANGAAAASVDEFTPSSQNIEQAAGLYTAQLSPFSASAAALPALTASAEIAAVDAQTIASAAGAPPPISTGALQRLNNSLEASGLNNQNINKIDGIASLTNTFDPTAFQLLVYQLKAQQSPPQGPTRIIGSP